MSQLSMLDSALKTNEHEQVRVWRPKILAADNLKEKLNNCEETVTQVCLSCGKMLFLSFIQLLVLLDKNGTCGFCQ